ncbi:hypothetical protein [Erwinia oleae]|uniref:hypothetical protein n=1 Tax=Erwinia oleae TaxID=796334 RepID=UPI0005599F97|nr:hypothetical protein [Erwinia oleae]
MSEVIKPANKQKLDGLVDTMSSEDARFILMRGDYTAEQIIKAAIDQGDIEPEDEEDWSKARYYQSWFKTSPLGGPDGYSRWNYPRDTPCRGAYFASVLCWD